MKCRRKQAEYRVYFLGSVVVEASGVWWKIVGKDYWCSGGASGQDALCLSQRQWTFHGAVLK